MQIKHETSNCRLGAALKSRPMKTKNGHNIGQQMRNRLRWFERKKAMRCELRWEPELTAMEQDVGEYLSTWDWTFDPHTRSLWRRLLSRFLIFVTWADSPKEWQQLQRIRIGIWKFAKKLLEKRGLLKIPLKRRDSQKNLSCRKNIEDKCCETLIKQNVD